MDTLTRMRAFLEVVEAHGFSAAARKVGRSKALLSKYVRELEDELGILLINRTTRQFSLTEAGDNYRESARTVLEQFDELQDNVRESGNNPHGKLRVSAPRTLMDMDFGIPIDAFLDAHPKVTLELDLKDQIVDLVEGRFDAAIRMSRLPDSSLIARRLAGFEVYVCASPATLKKHGTPNHPKELGDLPCLIDSNIRSRKNWLFSEPDGKEFSVAVTGPLEVNSPFVTHRAAVNDLGFTYVPDFVVADDLETGRLVRVLPEFGLKDAGLYVVYPHRRLVPAKVRAFVDFMAHWFKNNPQWPGRGLRPTELPAARQDGPTEPR
ncbi:MAG: LysR family transcriptional regulator [Pseudomonadota bacterium]